MFNYKPFTNKMFNEILKFGSFEDFLDFAVFIGRLRHLSVFNAAMVFCQRPGALWVENEDGWKRHGRFLKPSVSPLVILKPFAPVEFVYEYEDTVGEAVPYLLKTVEHAEIKKLNDVNLDLVIECLNKNGVNYKEKPLGERQFGSACIPQEKVLMAVKNKDKTVYVPVQGEITINPNKTVSQKYIAIIHELGHLFCGHLPLPEYAKKDKDRLIKYDRSYLDIFVTEHEAEAVCKIICEKINVKYDNYEYLKGYQIDGRAPEIDFNVVIAAADQICRLLLI